MRSQVTICWVPYHCNTYGNDKADELTDKGAKCNQEEAPVTLNVARAKIKNEKWRVSHERASKIFEERRRPREVEKKWPMRVRSMFSRLRSGHATELKAYRKRIGLDISDLCIHCDMDAVEDIHHILCVCPQLE